MFNIKGKSVGKSIKDILKNKKKKIDESIKKFFDKKKCKSKKCNNKKYKGG